MGALWSGTLTAHRYKIACPGCGSPNATTDCDGNGATVVICSCSPGGPFPMPLTIGGRGRDWPIDLTDVGIGAIDDDLVIERDGPRCAIPECNRRVAPGCKHCAKCCAGVQAIRLPCPDRSSPTCEGTMSWKAQRCRECARAKHYRDCAAQSRAKRQAARDAKRQMGAS